jgi:hypothetical protein
LGRLKPGIKRENWETCKLFDSAFWFLLLILILLVILIE